MTWEIRFDAAVKKANKHNCVVTHTGRYGFDLEQRYTREEAEEIIDKLNAYEEKLEEVEP
jgi:cobalamin biosynthesis protein CbiD